MTYNLEQRVQLQGSHKLLYYNAEHWRCLLELMLRIRNVWVQRSHNLYFVLCCDWAVNYAETKFCLVIRLLVDILYCYHKLVKIFRLPLRNGLCSWIFWLLCEGMGHLPNIICSVSSFRVQVDKHLWVMTLYGSWILQLVLSGWHTIGWDGCRHLAFPGFDCVCIYELMGDVTSGFPPNGSWISCGMKSVQ
jgi:hypothetical protein